MKYAKNSISADPGPPVADSSHLFGGEIMVVSEISHDNEVVAGPMPLGKCNAHGGQPTRVKS
jgi:hypothetical protein